MQEPSEVRRLHAEDAPTRAARARASDDGTVPAAEVGALLRWLATLVEANAVVEVGGGGGVSGLWLLAGMQPRGVLTSIEPDAHEHGLATQAYDEAEVDNRVRAVEGDASDVLPRLSDDAYDVVVLHRLVDDHVGHALRLVRPGGVVVVRGIEASTDARAVVRGLVSDDAPSPLERLTTTEHLDLLWLPLDGGVLVARDVRGV